MLLLGLLFATSLLAQAAAAALLPGVSPDPREIIAQSRIPLFERLALALLHAAVITLAFLAWRRPANGGPSP
jgi:hypothetical protein